IFGASGSTIRSIWSATWLGSTWRGRRRSQASRVRSSSRKGEYRMKRRLEIAKGSPRGKGPFAAIEQPIDAIRDGRMLIVVVDEQDRENEGDLTLAADNVTPEAINFMARYGRGLICLSLTPERLDELEIPLMVRDNTSRFETAFCTPIDVVGRTTTGISAHD